MDFGVHGIRSRKKYVDINLHIYLFIGRIECFDCFRKLWKILVMGYVFLVFGILKTIDCPLNYNGYRRISRSDLVLKDKTGKNTNRKCVIVCCADCLIHTRSRCIQADCLLIKHRPGGS